MICEMTDDHVLERVKLLNGCIYENLWLKDQDTDLIAQLSHATVEEMAGGIMVLVQGLLHDMECHLEIRTEDIVAFGAIFPIEGCLHGTFILKNE